MEKINEKEMCSVDFAFQRIGGKHKARILYHLKDEILRFGELRKKINIITPKMLTQTLRELEEDGLIERKVYPVVPPKVEYSLSKNGKELIPFIELMKKWGQKTMSKLGIKEVH